MILKVEPDRSTCQFGAQYLLRQLDAVFAELPGIRSAADLESIHRMRVASRRLRAGQAYFDACLPAKWVPDWEAQVREITRSLGQARDLDIQIQTLLRFLLLREPWMAEGGLRAWTAELADRRGSAQRQVHSAAAAVEEHPLFADIRNILQQLAGTSPLPASPPLLLQAKQALGRRILRLRSYDRYIRDPLRKKELHAMRIAAKRLRYTLEIFGPLDEAGFKPWLKEARRIQEELGWVHDCDVWLETRDLPEPAGDRGIALFRENRANRRARIYREFLLHWETGCREQTWDTLEQRLHGFDPAERTGRWEIPAPGTEVEDGHEDRALE